MEYLSYAGGNNSMGENSNSCYSRVDHPNSTFGLPLLHLKMSIYGWMNLWAVVEKIPTHAEKIDVFIYHIYHSGFSMHNRCEIEIAPEHFIEFPKEH